MRLKQSHIDIREILERSLHHWTHRVPFEAAIPASQRRDCDRTRLETGDLCQQIDKAFADELQLGSLAPMLFRREVDDVSRPAELAQIVDEHAPWANLSCPAGRSILAEAPRPPSLELQRDALAHDANAVDSIDKDLDIILLQKITLYESYHDGASHGPVRRPLLGVSR
jgi:hypothetical protein